MCAAAGDSRCEFRLAKLMLNKSDTASDEIQATAWAELAADQGVTEAKTLAESQRSAMSARDAAAVEKLKKSLLAAQALR